MTRVRREWYRQRKSHHCDSPLRAIRGLEGMITCSYLASSQWALSCLRRSLVCGRWDGSVLDRWSWTLDVGILACLKLLVCEKNLLIPWYSSKILYT